MQIIRKVMVDLVERGGNTVVKDNGLDSQDFSQNYLIVSP